MQSRYCIIPRFKWPHELISGGQFFIIWSSPCSHCLFLSLFHTVTHICLHTHADTHVWVYFIPHTCTHIGTQTYICVHSTLWHNTWCKSVSSHLVARFHFTPKQKGNVMHRTLTSEDASPTNDFLVNKFRKK